MATRELGAWENWVPLDQAPNSAAIKTLYPSPDYEIVASFGKGTGTLDGWHVYRQAKKRIYLVGYSVFWIKDEADLLAKMTGSPVETYETYSTFDEFVDCYKKLLCQGLSNLEAAFAAACGRL